MHLRKLVRIQFVVLWNSRANQSQGGPSYRINRENFIENYRFFPLAVSVCECECECVFIEHQECA